MYRLLLIVKVMGKVGKMPARRVTRSASAKAAAKTSSSSPSISSASAANPITTSRAKSTTSSTFSKAVAISKPKPASNPSPPSTFPSSPSDHSISFSSASAFDQYLLQSGSSTTPSGIWLRITKKSSISLIPSITYHEAVDIALCHGWIDGQRKSLDSISFLQRFTPRRPRSLWSRRNVQRVEVLTAEGRMKPAGIAAVDAAKEDGRWERAYAGTATMEVPRDFEDALAGNEAARTAFQGLSRAQRYSLLWRIQTAAKRETRDRKIREFVDLLAEGKTL
ncbi:hypothetical protein CCMA1212_008503 [Trichoderma ghanense]|uniref:Bacteriocin-protection protein n=1 Tax=Trichoderma ghanense TaxID=65468 RepID=A0ABY2GVH0_9HYPO